MNIDRYYAQKVVPCRDCSSDDSLDQYLEYTKLPPFVGEETGPFLLLGHSPRVRENPQKTMTLDLDRVARLRKYIVNEVLTPLGIDLSLCTATNVVKCNTKAMPEDTTINGKPFMERAFQVCRNHLVAEIGIVRPKLIISLSERVAILLQQEFAADGGVKPMRETFGILRSLFVADKKIMWIPVVHLPKQSVRNHYFPAQTERLSRLRVEMAKMLP